VVPLRVSAPTSLLAGDLGHAGDASRNRRRPSGFC
jgi:hypothetical protein